MSQAHPAQGSPARAHQAAGRLLALLLVVVSGQARWLEAAENAGEPPNSGMAPERQQEGDWVDSRWNQTEVGPCMASSLNLPGASIARALSVRVGTDAPGGMAYDTKTGAWRGAWQNGFLDFDTARYGLLRPPRPHGTLVAQGPGPDTNVVAHYTGLHLQGDRVTLESVINDTPILETPWLVTNGPLVIFLRSLEVGAGSRPVRIPLAISTVPPRPLPSGTGTIALVTAGGSGPVAWLVPADDAQLVSSGPVASIEIAARAKPRLLRIAFCAAPNADPASAITRLDAALRSTEGTPSPAQCLAPGPARWRPEPVTRGQRGLDLDLLSVDTLTAPYENPWKALLFFSGIDFTPDGVAYACTIHGDVWKISGLDSSLQELHWHRFATGLFQPLGLKVRDGQVFVLGRDQITRLHDQNQDGEADYYECFHRQIATSLGGHDYVTCLEKDDQGRFYYVDPIGLHRVSADGRTAETIATGWRNPNGLGVSPDGSVLTVAPQQGTWTPSSQISEARAGGYYGYPGPRVAPGRPVGYDAPLCWIPHRVDNSSGSQVWVPRDLWGPLGGHLLHLLWGRCGLMLVLRDQVDHVAQGAVVPLPGRFLSGPHRGSFNPRDGHLYIAGSTGWQTAAAKDGALHRVRFTGKPVLLPLAWHAHSNGISLTFAQPLDPAAAQDPGSYSLHQWNYRYAAEYGSKDWSVAHPDHEGRDEITVESARLLPDQKTVFLQTTPLSPVMQVEVKYSLNTTGGKAFRNQLWLTLNALDRAR